MARTFAGLERRRFILPSYKSLPFRQENQLFTAEIVESAEKFLKNKRVLCGLGDFCGEIFWLRLCRSLSFVADVAILCRRLFEGGA
jgi:hypothetical protein